MRSKTTLEGEHPRLIKILDDAVMVVMGDIGVIEFVCPLDESFLWIIRIELKERKWNGYKSWFWGHSVSIDGLKKERNSDRLPVKYFLRKFPWLKNYELKEIL